MGVLAVRSGTMGIRTVGHHASMRNAMALGLAHHLGVLGLFLRSLFRSQQAHHVATGLDGCHPQPDLQIFALSQLGFDRGEIGLVIVGQRLQFTFRNLDVGFGLDPCFVKIELDVLQFSNLIRREPNILVVLEQVPDQMAGPAMHHSFAIAVGPAAVPPSSMTITRIIGPQTWCVYHEQTYRGDDNSYRCLCERYHEFLLG